MGKTTNREPGRIRVLHVDDKPDFADLAATFLEREDSQFAVETVTSPSDGLDRLTDTEFDCIISDYDMPDQNGIEFLETVRTDYPDLPFILYTGKGSEGIASKAISAGVTDYLQKESGTDQYVVLGNRVKNAVEQFRSQRALTERNRELLRYKRMINSMDEAACIYDSEGRFELVNKYLAEWYDTTSEELAGEQSTLISRIREQTDGDPFQELLSGERNELRGELNNDFPEHGYAVLEYHLTPLRVDGTIGGVVGIARDITDRRAQRAELEYKDRAIDAAPIGITISDPSQDDNPLIYVNDCFTELTGYTKKEALGSNCRFLQGEHTSPEAVARIREAIDNEETVTVELRNYRQDGTEFWNRLSIAPVCGDGGETTNYIGFQQDVTGEKEREQELHEEQAFIEQSLDTLVDIFYYVDTNGDFQRWNTKLPELTGYSNEEIGSMNALEFFEGAHREAIEHSIREILETGSHVTEAEITTADGRQVPHEFRGVRMTADDGEPTGIIGIARDITERKKREHQLEEKTEELEQLATKFETQYRTLFEEAPVMTILTRAEDGEPIIDDCNSQFIKTLGYDENAILDRELAEFYTRDSAELLLEEGGYKRSLEGKFDREKRDLVTADGEVVETLLRAVPRRRADDGIIGTMAMYIDITERESVKRANERLEEFTSIVSHDLRNPLNVASGRLELAAEECASDHFDDIEQALNRMETLIDNLLTLAREGKAVTDTQLVDLTAMINGCWENVETNQAVLVTNIDRSVWADKSRLKQLFENLFRNAVEHGGADVTVTVGRLDDGFYIEDDGSGIPSDKRDDIFEAGYSRWADGTGFGLSIVEQIVTAHDWQIRVTDGSDGGARFEITDVEITAA